MSDSVAGPHGSRAQSLLDRMRRARATAARPSHEVPDDDEVAHSDDVDASTSTAPTSAPDDHLVDRAYQLADDLLAGRIDPSTARRRMITACLDSFPLDVDRPTAEDDLKSVLSGDLQFRAEVDNMLVLAARDLAGDDD